MNLFPIPADGQANYKMVAKTIYGLENLCMIELLKLGAENPAVHNRAVSFEGNLGVMYKANLLLRTALRVLVQFAEFEVNNEDELYEAVKSIAWENLISVDDTIAIDTVLNTEIFNHSQYISQKTKDAICDRFRELCDKRPSVDLDNPTLRLHLHIAKNKCVIALDSSGDSLHKRGYREKTNLAPINEVLAAGLVQLSEWDMRSTFIDPMCGSATILIEAAMLAANIPAGYFREQFGFMNWKQVLPFNQELWEKIHSNAIERISTENIALCGIELSPNVARKGKENVKRSKTEDMIRIRCADFLDSDAPTTVGSKPILLMNPPYGERMVKDDIWELYHKVGDTFKKKYAGYECWIISSNLEALKNVGLSTSKRITVYNGQLECRFFRYSIYQGTKKWKGEE
ncbi:MAG: THUMP domain-containing protein [Bacteroidetes bacterium]|nr:THUMP domain-containing protein [Bacteroidota bacterium]